MSNAHEPAVEPHPQHTWLGELCWLLVADPDALYRVGQIAELPTTVRDMVEEMLEAKAQLGIAAARLEWQKLRPLPPA